MWAATSKTKTGVAMETVAVMGLGYVGLPVAALARRKGFSVLGFDAAGEKVAAITSGRFSAGDSVVRETFQGIPLDATTDPKRLATADVIVVAVPTPIDHDAHPDLGPIQSAVEAVARYARPGVLLSIESTVNPGVCEEFVVPLLQKLGRDPERGDIFLVHCPERVNPGDARWTTQNIPRVLGGYTSEATEQGIALYTRLIDAPVRRMSSIRAAEAVKIIENAFRDVNIAFVNELAQSFDRLGIDVAEVIDGAATKPFAFLPHYPGAGVGGHCIPVDPYYLIEHAQTKGFEHKFLKLAREINKSMPRYTVERLKEALRQTQGTTPQHSPLIARDVHRGDIVHYTTPTPVQGGPGEGEGTDRLLEGVHVALLGLAYKRDVADLRESPALEIEKILRAEGALVSTFDPFVPGTSTAQTLAEALRSAVAVVLATDHTEFRNLAPAHLAGTAVRVLVDGRNCLNHEAFRAAGYTILGIGR